MNVKYGHHLKISFLEHVIRRYKFIQLCIIDVLYVLLCVCVCVCVHVHVCACIHVMLQSLFLCAVMLREEDSSLPQSLCNAAIGSCGGEILHSDPVTSST